MDVDPSQRGEQLRTALRACGADLTLFDDIDLKTMWDTRYRSVRALQGATREGLTVARLPPGLVDHILMLQGGGAGGVAAAMGAAAGPGAGSTVAAGVGHTISRRAMYSCKFVVSVLGDAPGAAEGSKVVRRRRCTGVIVTETCAATYAHSSHSTWKCGEEKELEVHSQDADRMRVIKAQVVIIDTRKDFIILKFSEKWELDCPRVDTVIPGEEFYVHGMSCPSSDATSISHGVVAGTSPDKYSHMFGDISSGKGDSGGGVFSVHSGKLVGMLVGRDTQLQKSRFVPAVLLHAAALTTEKPEERQTLPDLDEGTLSDQGA